MRCRSCDKMLEAFDDMTYCKKCIKLSEDNSTLYKDPQHLLLTSSGKGNIVTSNRSSKE